jgi:hypothetical protein
MKPKMLTSAVMVALMLGTYELPLAAQGNGAQNGRLQIVSGTLTEQDKMDLQYLQEEEKLARDVYLTLLAKWNLVVFQNISESEQRHTDTALQLLNAYQMPTLALTEVGKFHNPTLQTLYNDLISRGAQNTTEALLVGALVEEVDIADLQKMISVTKNTDLINTYTKLMLASYRHLNSFVSLWKNQTGSTSYKAQVLSQTEVDKILSCSPLTVNPNLQVHIPNLKYKNLNFWATLDYIPNQTNQHVFKVTDYGLNLGATNCTSATLVPLDLSLKTPQATFKHQPSNDGKLYFSLDKYTP